MNILVLSINNLSDEVLYYLDSKYVKIYICFSIEEEYNKINNKNYKNVIPLKININKISELKKIRNLEIDVILCNIGIISNKIVFNKQDLRHIYDHNVFSIYEILKVALINQKKNNHGRIILINYINTLDILYNISNITINYLIKSLVKNVNQKNIKFSIIEFNYKNKKSINNISNKLIDSIFSNHPKKIYKISLIERIKSKKL